MSKKNPRKGTKLVGKDGRRLWKNINKYLKKKEEELGPASYRTLKNDLMDAVEDKRSQRRGLTTNGFEWRKEHNKIRRMLGNMGYTAEEFAERNKIPVEDILNENNWKKDKFIHGRDVYEFRFTYNGTNLIKKENKNE